MYFLLLIFMLIFMLVYVYCMQVRHDVGEGSDTSTKTVR